MIRQICLALVISGLAALALRDWYKSLCGLILLVGIVEHADMPKSIFGIQGLNPWNILLVVVVGAWLLNRGQEELEWDMPFAVQALLAIYLLIIGVGFFRLVMDMGGFVDYYESFDTEPPSRILVTSEFLINCVKWIVPGVLLFDGCRSLSRLTKEAMEAVIDEWKAMCIRAVRDGIGLREIGMGDVAPQRTAVLMHRTPILKRETPSDWVKRALQEFAGMDAQDIFDALTRQARSAIP